MRLIGMSHLPSGKSEIFDPICFLFHVCSCFLPYFILILVSYYNLLFQKINIFQNNRGSNSFFDNSTGTW